MLPTNIPANQIEYCRAANTVAERVTMAVTGQGDTAGRAWEIVIIGPATDADLVTVNGQEAVRSKNGRCYAVFALREAASLFNGARVYDDHLTDQEFSDRGGLRSVAKEWLGSIGEARFDEARKAIIGTLHLVDDAFGNKLARAAEGRVLDSIGLSIDVMQRGVMAVLNGEKIQLVEAITKVNSVDAVGEPAAGGRFVRALESIQESGDMEEVLKQVEQLMAAIDASMLPDATKVALKAELDKVKAGATKPEGAKNPDEDAPAVEAEKVQEAKAAISAIAGIAQRSIEALKAQPAPTPDPVAEARDLLAQAKAESTRIIEAARAADAQRALEAELNASGLPDKARAIVRAQFATGGNPADVKRAIEAQRDLLASLFDTSGNVTAHARQAIHVGRVTEADRFQIGLMRLMRGPQWKRDVDLTRKDQSGRRVFESFISRGITDPINDYLNSDEGKKDNLMFRNLGEWAYQAGVQYLFGIEDRATEANLTVAQLGSITKNAVNLFAAADYSMREQWWKDIVDEMDADTIDDVTLIRLFGMSSLPIVAEGEAYTELSMSDEEETGVFKKRGGVIGVTLETLLKAKIEFIQSLPDRLASSWYNTISDRVANVFSGNSGLGPTLTDGGTLFNSTSVATATGHKNWLTTALAASTSAAAWREVVTAMMKQTDQPLGAGRRLGNENRPKYLLVPIDLGSVGRTLRNTEKGLPGTGNNDYNEFYQGFEVIEVPNWTDTTDWASLAKPKGKSPIKLVYVAGRRTPELYESRDEGAGSFFSNDTMFFKIRQFLAQKALGTTPEEYCAPVSDWRSLHKNTVAG